MSDKLQGGIKAGSTDVSVTFVLRKTSDSTEQTGKVAADMTLSYLRQGGTRTAITAADLAAVDSAHSDGGVKELDSTNMPGAYRLDLPDAAVATGADWVHITVKVASTFIFHERYILTTNVVQTGDSYAIVNSGTHGNAALKTLIDTVDNFVDTEVADIQTKIGTPAGVSLAADIAAVKAETAAIVDDTGTSGVVVAAGSKTGYSLAAGGAGSGAIAAAELNNIADAVLDRNMATGVDSGSTTVRTPRQSLRALRNKVAIAAGTATVYKEDDATSSWTAAVTTTAGDPISAVDPAGP